MRKHLLLGLVLAIMPVLCILKLIPLYAQDGLVMEIREPRSGEVVTGPTVPILVSFRNNSTVPIVRFDVLFDGKQYFDGHQFLGGTFTTLQSQGTFKTERCDITKAHPSAGSHSLTIRLTDAQGHVCEQSQLIYFQPSLDLRPGEKNLPVVRIVSPANGATIDQKTDIKLEASDDTKLKLVKLIIDNQVKAMTNQELLVYAWDPIAGKYASGPHTISASAWDIFDNQGDSQPVTVMVMNSWFPGSAQLTPIDPRDGQVSVAVLPGLVTITGPSPVTTAMTITRLPFSNVISPLWGTGSGIVMPVMATDYPRTYLMPTADTGLVAIIPTQLDLAQAPTPQWTAINTPALAGVLGAGIFPMQSSQYLAPQPVALILPQGAIAGAAQTIIPTMDSQHLPDGAPTAPKVVAELAPTVQGIAISSIGKQAPGALSEDIHVPVTVAWLVPTDDQLSISPAPLSGDIIQRTNVTPTRTASSLNDIQAPVAASIEPGTRHMTVATPTPTTVSSIPSQLTGPSIDRTGLSRTVVAQAPKTVESVKQPNGQYIHTPAQTPRGPKENPKVGVTVNPTAPSQQRTVVAQLPGSTPRTIAHPSVKRGNPSISSSTPASQPKTPSTQPLAALRNQYQVKAGDTLYSIAADYGTTVAVLQKLNPTVDSDQLVVGAKINVPRKSQILLDNAALTGMPAPYIAGEGYTMAPMRSLIEAKGGVIVWLPQTRQVNAWANNNFFGVTIGKREARLNTSTYLLPVAAVVRNERAMVPLRFLAAGLQLKVSFDEKTGTYVLSSVKP